MASEAGVPVVKERAKEGSIFVSHARRDNTASPGEQGWVDEFCDALEHRLYQLSAARFRTWRDMAELRPDIPFWLRMRAAVRSTVVFIAVVSPSYVQSEWCMRELEEAEAKNIRTIKVVKEPIDHELQGEYLASIVGYRFYDATSDLGGRHEFTEPNRKLFYQGVTNIAHDIMQMHAFRGPSKG